MSPHAYLKSHTPQSPGQFCAKTAFVTRKEARTAIGSIPNSLNRPVTMGKGVLKPYHCRACGEWHIGHEPSKKQLKAKRSKAAKRAQC